MTIRYSIEKALSQGISTISREMMITVEGNDFKVIYQGELIAEKSNQTLKVMTTNTSKAVKTRLNVLLELYGLPLIFQLDYQWYFEDSVKVEASREFEVSDEYYNIYNSAGHAIELLNATSFDEIRDWVQFRYGDTFPYKTIKDVEQKYNLIINKTKLPT